MTEPSHLHGRNAAAKFYATGLFFRKMRLRDNQGIARSHMDSRVTEGSIKLMLSVYDGMCNHFEVIDCSN